MVECKSYNKLVRDNTVKVLSENGLADNIKVDTARTEAELNTLIYNKLLEYANRLKENCEKTGAFNITDIVNLQEILDKIKHEAHYTKADYKIEQERIAASNGKFDLNIVLKYLEKEM